MAGDNYPNDERRNYYRLEDRVYLEFRLAAEEEVSRYLRQRDEGPQPVSGASQQLDYLSRQMAPLIASIRAESPAIAQYLEHLDRKVDIVAGMVFFDRFNEEMGRHALQTSNTLDISEGGISFLATEPLAVDSHLFCRLIIAGPQMGLETFGKVVHCEAVEGGDHRIGVGFPYINDYQRKLLSRYIFDRQREQLRQRQESTNY